MAGGQDSEVVLEPVKMVSNEDNLDLLTVIDTALLQDKFTININMAARYSGVPTINFHIYTIEPRGKKRAGHENEGEQKKQLRMGT